MKLFKLLKDEINYKEYPDGYVDQILNDSAEFYTAQKQRKGNMFGYPANLKELSPLTKILYYIDISGPLANNCGDNYERGNYAMDSKDIENKIVALFAQKFGAGTEYWGYITSGGSESNSCGIDLAFLKQPNGILYFSSSAHYSIVKHSSHYKSQVILNDRVYEDKIDVTMLCNIARSNYETLGAPANLVLTFGTTKFGECDDIDEIVSMLHNFNIPHYIHVDAALYGGIPNNQVGAPLITNMQNRGVNSIAVSFHKYIGFPAVKSLILATEKPKGKYIPYIGHTDTTTSGSRAIPAFALYNHVRENLELQDPDDYQKNIIYLEKLFESFSIQYYRANKSNIFIIDEPDPSVVKRFQLSCFRDRAGKKKAHIIVFPYQSKEALKELALSIKK